MHPQRTPIDTPRDVNRSFLIPLAGSSAGVRGTTGMSHVMGKLLVGQLAPVDEIWGGGGSSKSL